MLTRSEAFRVMLSLWGLGTITLTFAAVITLPAEQSTLSWESTQWTVTCTPELEEAITAGDVGVSVADVCDPASPISAAAAARYELETASPWLRGLGFSGPRLSERDGTRYVARLDSFGRDFFDMCQLKAARYVIEDRALRLSPCLHFAVVLPPAVGLLQNRGALIGMDPVHELFHAVQLGYGRMNTAPGARWILEGTAFLAEVAAARRAGTGRPDPVARRRYYDEPLQIPPDIPEFAADSDAFQDWAYGSWEFWDFLGEHLSSADRIQYLHTVFRQDLTSENNGLTGVDAGLRALGTEGLYDLYPAFVAARLDEPCYFKGLGTFEVAKAGAPCTPRRTAPTWVDLQPGQTRRIMVSPAEMATGAIVVSADVPANRIGQLRVEIPADADGPAYHLVVGSERLDVDVNGHHRFGRRNRFLGSVMSGDEPTLVKVAHVPEGIAGVEGGEGMTFGSEIPVEVALEVVQGVVTFSGGVSGTYAAHDRTSASVGLGPGGSCQMLMMLTASTDPNHEPGDWVEVSGLLPAPLRAGSVPIVSAIGGLGTLNVRSAPGRTRPGRTGFMHPAVADGGTFEILRVSGEVLESRFRASVPAESQTAAHTVDAHVVARLGGWVGATRREAHPCYPR